MEQTPKVLKRIIYKAPGHAPKVMHIDAKYCESSWFFHEQDICPSCGVSFCCYNYDKKAPMRIGHCPNCGECLSPKGAQDETDLST